jgi:hypothetical protein
MAIEYLRDHLLLVNCSRLMIEDRQEKADRQADQQEHRDDASDNNNSFETIRLPHVSPRPKFPMARTGPRATSPTCNIDLSCQTGAKSDLGIEVQ